VAESAKGAPETALKKASKTPRIAVTDFELSGVRERAGRVVSDSVVAEVRKLDGVVVIGMDEIRRMLDFEAQKVLMGCEDESCLSEIAQALGADILVTGRLSRLNEQHFFVMQRMDPTAAAVTARINQPLVAEDGEEFLAAVGPAGKKLFPEYGLKKGMKRGVDAEMALRLNPPPLPIWVFWSGVAVSGAAAAVAGTFFALNVNAAATAEDLREEAQNNDQEPTTWEPFRRQAELANSYGYAAVGTAGLALGLGLATGAAAVWTDWLGYQEIDLE
jgi:hypothetical protein